jgi:hypothetical protein
VLLNRPGYSFKNSRRMARPGVYKKGGETFADFG